MNVPGCIHDSMVCEWGDIYSQLEKVHEETGGTCTVDSANKVGVSQIRNTYMTPLERLGNYVTN